VIVVSATVEGVTVTFAVIDGAKVVKVSDFVDGIKCSANTGANFVNDRLSVDGMTVTLLEVAIVGAKVAKLSDFVCGMK